MVQNMVRMHRFCSVATATSRYWYTKCVWCEPTTQRWTAWSREDERRRVENAEGTEQHRAESNKKAEWAEWKGFPRIWVTARHSLFVVFYLFYFCASFAGSLHSFRTHTKSQTTEECCGFFVSKEYGLGCDGVCAMHCDTIQAYAHHRSSTVCACTGRRVSLCVIGLRSGKQF